MIRTIECVSFLPIRHSGAHCEYQKNRYEVADLGAGVLVDGGLIGSGDR